MPHTVAVVSTCITTVLLFPGTPRNVQYADIKKDLEGITGVEMVHSLNVWSLTMDKVAVGVHLAVGRLKQFTCVRYYLS